MKEDLISKIQNILDLKNIDEDHVRSLMILLRKNLESLADNERTQYTTLNLFCNWSAHNNITKSLTGLKTLSRINSTLVRVKQLTNTEFIRSEMTSAIGFNDLRNELISLLDYLGIKHRLLDDKNWQDIFKHVIEIIRDVPLAFPPIDKLNEKQKKIYDSISANPIKPGAGVILVQLSILDYNQFGYRQPGPMMCLLIRSADTTTLIIPLLLTL